MNCCLLLIIMTTLVGVIYPEGLVYASDLLGKDGNENRTEIKKLYFKNGIVIFTLFNSRTHRKRAS